jgi:hypothetical protein
MYWFINAYLQFKDGDKILDIGGNDGTLLNVFKQRNSGIDVLNVDASENIVKEAMQKGINSINGFWGKELASKLNTKFKAIITTNCFQHTAPIESFVEGVAMSLEQRGIWCLEFPYWKTSMDTLQYDQTYHEHIYYYLLNPLKLLLDKFGLHVIKVTPYPIHGGTLRVLISQKGELGEAWQPGDWYIDRFFNEETFELKDYIEWGNKVKQHIENSRNVLLSLKSKGFKIAGFGAAAKGCVFLNSTGIDYNIIDYVIDDTDLKQNKFIPGTGIPVVSRDMLRDSPVDYIVILAHNFAEYIISSLIKNGYKGKFIVFFPEYKVVVNEKDLNR